MRLDHPVAQQLLAASAALKRAWARSLLRIYSLQLSFVDRNVGTPYALDASPLAPRGPFLFVHLNQNSLLESAVFPSVPAPFPTSFLMNWEFTLIPFLGWNLRMTGVTIDRANAAQARAGVDAVVRMMREEGRSVYMSIEGHRSESGALHPYKNGAAVIAIQSQATIVPVISRGLREALPFGDWRVRPGKVEVIYERSVHTRRAAGKHALLDVSHSPRSKLFAAG